MSYIAEDVKIPINEDIEKSLLECGIEVRAISIDNKALGVAGTGRRVAYKLSTKGNSINENFNILRGGIKKACEILEKKNPKTYPKEETYEALLDNVIKLGILREYKDSELAEKLI